MGTVVVNHFEIFKQNANDNAGIQSRLLLHREELAARLCGVRGCAGPGHAQIAVPSHTVRVFRVICRRHLVLYSILVDALIGDPSPGADARELAEYLNVDFMGLLSSDLGGVGLFNPAYARCVTCGGGFVAEKQGMYAGVRYIHTCGEGKAK